MPFLFLEQFIKHRLGMWAVIDFFQKMSSSLVFYVMAIGLTNTRNGAVGHPCFIFLVFIMPAHWSSVSSLLHWLHFIHHPHQLDQV